MAVRMLTLLLQFVVFHGLASATQICGLNQECGAGTGCECLQWASECIDASCQLTALGLALVTACIFVAGVVLIVCCCLLWCCCRPSEGCCGRAPAPSTTIIQVPMPYEYHHASGSL